MRTNDNTGVGSAGVIEENEDGILRDSTPVRATSQPLTASAPGRGIDSLPPHDIEAEEAVIASALVDVEAWAKVSGLLRPADFFREKHGLIFATCVELVAEGVALNQITVGHALARKDRLEEVGGIAFLSKLVTELPTPVGVEHYAGIVKRDSLYREVIIRADTLQRSAYRANGNLPELLDDFLRNAEEMRVAAAPMLGSASRCDIVEGAAFSESVGEAPHIIDGIVPRPGLTIIAGMAESFKSWITADMALSIAAGKTCLGRFPVEQGPAIIFDQQVDEREVKRRLQKLAEGRGLDLAALPIAAVVDEGLDLNSPADLAVVIDIIKQRGANYALFDSAPDFFPGINSNDNSEVRLAMSKFKRIGRETGAAIMGIHHLRKTSKEGVNTPEERLFGSVYWRNDADSYFAFALHGADRVLAACGKAKRRRRVDPFLIVCDGDQDDSYVRLRYAGEADESLDKQGRAEGWVLSTLAERGAMRRPDLLAAADAAKVAGKRTMDNVLGSLVGSGLVGKASKPGEAHGAMYYWLEDEAPPWTATEPLL